MCRIKLSTMLTSKYKWKGKMWRVGARVIRTLNLVEEEIRSEGFGEGSKRAKGFEEEAREPREGRIGRRRRRSEGPREGFGGGKNEGFGEGGKEATGFAEEAREPMALTGRQEREGYGKGGRGAKDLVK